MKIYYMGKRLRPRSKKTSKFKKGMTFIELVIISAIIIGMSLFFLINLEENSTTYEKPTVKIEKVDIKILDLMKKDLVKTLRYEELNRELVPGELLYTNDSRKSMRAECNRIGGKRNIKCDSWGVLQFKITTVQYYYDKLYNKTITEIEAMLIALDEEKSMDLAEDIIFKIEGGIWNWENSVNKKKAYYMKQIPFIRDLEASL